MTISDRETPDTTTRSATRLPGDLDMWVMILGDLFFFGCYFIAYMIFRTRSPEAFAAAQRHLNMGIGVANTIVLLTSSMFAAAAVAAVRRGAVPTARRLILATAGCGLLFAALKAVEWHQELSHGYTMSSEFFSFYYVLTGVHLAHVALGVLILGVVGRELRREQRVEFVEQGVLFWHMIDLLWLVIFATVYLMR
ncbi:cytochrome c oxidase subunit 3 [Nocardia sp. alder85J]|uniref:cytochrome c oxidase subunit 3 n=1 Tax=Nocardia sp. alder85J TaxID=2862949 RepID=UPI001CD6500C|nr:cytochrome c oxidase subunit 3 [Nocardia sp. alder85J]MCX4098089.1 cytochrome c oxidase subunit 3 [Nocardia sp. alder85J]